MDAAYALTGALAVVQASACVLAAWGFGRWLAGRWLFRRIVLPAGARPLAEVGFGTGILGYIAFSLGVAGALRAGVLAVVVLVGVLLAVVALGEQRVRTGLIGRELIASRLARWSAAAAALAGAFALLGALLPETEYDALWYHLAFPARYLSAGRLIDIPCEHMSPTPQHVELLFTYGLLMGDARAVKLLHAACGALAAIWAGWLAARLVGPRWAAVAAALVLTAPTLTWEMTTAYNDLALAFLGTGAVAMVLEWRTRGERRLLAAGAALLGVGLAGKHLAFFFLAPLALAVLLTPLAQGRRTARQRVADTALFCAVALALALPWYIRAWYYTGNPLFPMFYDLLTGGGVEVRRWDAQAEAGWANAMNRYGDGRSPLALVLVPWRATWASVRYAGSLGPAWLLFLPLLPFAWRALDVRLRLVALLAGAYFLAWMSPYSSFQIRYLVPIVPLLAVLVAASVRHLGGVLGRAGWPAACRALHVMVVAILVLNLPPFYPLADARAGWIPHTLHPSRDWGTALGLGSPDQYLVRWLEPYRAVRYMNAALASGARVVSFAEAANFYARPELVMDFSRCVVAGLWGARPGDEERAFRALRAAGVTHIMWDKTRRDVADSSFAIRSAVFRERYAAPVYADDVVDLDALRSPTEAGVTLTPTRRAARPGG